MAKTNPNGANQYKVDPRQALFFEYFFDPESPTFSNGLQSGLKAGFDEGYARVLVSHMPAWLSEKVNELDIISKAEKNLPKFLESKDERIGLDTTKFVLERLKKDKYSTRQELTGKDGKDLVSPEQAKKILNLYTDENGKA